MSDAEPVEVGVHEHDALPDTRVTLEQPLIAVPPSLNVTVPEAGVGTLAEMEYVVPTVGLDGKFDNVTEVVFHVETLSTLATGRVLTLVSTGVTRTS